MLHAFRLLTLRLWFRLRRKNGDAIAVRVARNRRHLERGSTRFVLQAILHDGIVPEALPPRRVSRHGRAVWVDPPSVAVLPVWGKARLP